MATSVKKLVKQRMIRKSQQTITLLAVASSGVNTIRDLKLASEHYGQLMTAIDAFSMCLYAFPEAGSRKKNVAACKKQLQSLKKFLDTERAITAVTFSSITQLILEDLSLVIKDPIKKLVMEQAIEETQKLSDLLDPDGDCYSDYEIAEELVTNVYREIGFKGGKR